MPQNPESPRPAPAMAARAALATALCVAALTPGPATAAEDDPAAVGNPVARDVEQPTPGRRWDASIGMVTSYAPDYAGAGQQRLRVGPGFYLRWGRISFATRSAFVSRSADPGARGGMRIDLSPSERWRVNLGLRYDFGRQESSNDALRGLGDVPATLRVRLGTSYGLDDGWSVGGSLTIDAFGRGGGHQGDVSVGKQWRLTPDTSLGVGLGLAFAGDRYMQSYFGVTPEQAARTGYPVYEPPAGLRDVGLAITGRTELGHPWAVFYGGSVSRLLGPAAASPLTRQRSSWSLNSGFVYRF